MTTGSACYSLTTIGLNTVITGWLTCNRQTPWIFGLALAAAVGAAQQVSAVPDHGRSAAAAPVEIHVALTGDDTAPGTAARPVTSFARAQELARQAPRAGRSVHVIVHAGTYYLPATVVFTTADGGFPGAPIVWRAAEGAQVVVSGGTRLALTWEPSPLGPGIFQARVPAGLEIDELFLDGQRQWMARFPNRESGDGLNVFDTWKLDHRAKPDPARDPLAPGRIARWADPTGAFFHAMHPALWGGVHWRITGKNPDGTLAMVGGTQNNRGTRVHATYRFIENVREELDAPGEWFHDRAQSTIHLFPPAGTDLARATVEVVRLRHLFEVRGTREQPVRHLEFRGLTFRQAARTLMDTKEPLLRSDWTVYRGGAVLLTGTEDCEIADCTFDQVGGNALFVDRYHRRLAVRRCLIREAGASGICFTGDPAAVRNALFRYEQRLDPADLDRTPGPIGHNFPADCLVEDCLITRTGRVEKQTAGVAIDMARAITVRHCSIYDVPRAGINIGGGTWGGHVIEHCDVFDTVKETGDHGSFNSWGRDRFWRSDPAAVDAHVAADPTLPFLDAQEPTILRHNRWRCDHGWDIDLDDGSSNYVIRDNLCLRGGIKLREGYRRVVENNVVPPQRPASTRLVQEQWRHLPPQRRRLRRLSPRPHGTATVGRGTRPQPRAHPRPARTATGGAPRATVRPRCPFPPRRRAVSRSRTRRLPRAGEFAGVGTGFRRFRNGSVRRAPARPPGPFPHAVVRATRHGGGHVGRPRDAVVARGDREDPRHSRGSLRCRGGARHRRCAGGDRSRQLRGRARRRATRRPRNPRRRSADPDGRRSHPAGASFRGRRPRPAIRPESGGASPRPSGPSLMTAGPRRKTG